MKASILRTLWISLASVFLLADMSTRAILKRMTGTINRDWVDAKMQQWTHRMINLFKIHYKIVNPHQVEPKPGQPTIVMCNHSSLFDIPLSLLAFPTHPIRMLAKKELSKIPLMGRAMVAAEFPSIDRKNRYQAIKDLEGVQKLLKSGIVMWIAPEGTRSKDGNLAAFKKGGFITAIQASATIIPIGIRGAYDVLPARTYQINLNQHAEIHIGKPIDASQFTLENKDALIAKVHQEMLALVGQDGVSPRTEKSPAK